MDKIIKEIYDAVVNGNASTVKTRVQAALDAGTDLESLLNEGMIAPMKEVGELFESGEYFVPEMLISARAMQAGMTCCVRSCSQKISNRLARSSLARSKEICMTLARTWSR
jgi:methanogenic corrinoid protein MtbC1